MNSKQVAALCAMFIAALQVSSQDIIIFRDGRMKEVKIIQTSNDRTLFTESRSKQAQEETVDNTDVFMLKFKTRGNVVFNSRGERILTTSQPVKHPKDAIIVYCKDGREIPAYNLTMDTNILSFTTDKKGREHRAYLPKVEVFMIAYPDGTRDVLTNLAEAERREREAEAARQRAEQEAQAAAEAEKARAASEAEAAADSKHPRRATIVTTKGVRMKVWVCADDGTTVAYKKTDSPKASVFRLSKNRIKSITY